MVVVHRRQCSALGRAIFCSQQIFVLAQNETRARKGGGRRQTLYTGNPPCCRAHKKNTLFIQSLKIATIISFNHNKLIIVSDIVRYYCFSVVWRSKPHTSSCIFTTAWSYWSWWCRFGTSISGGATLFSFCKCRKDDYWTFSVFYLHRGSAKIYNYINV